jgi:transketolase
VDIEADADQSLSGKHSPARELAALAKRIRLHVLRMVHDAKSSHVGTCFSMAELLAVLYGEVLRVDPRRPAWTARDRLVVSKGHGCAALYAVLAEREFFPREWLQSFYRDGARLAGHVTHKGVPGVELSTGALGHGLPVACGMALAGRRGEPRFRVFTLLSDGECDEGSTWEAAMFAPHHRLDNLAVIIDFNKIQSLGTVEEVLALEPLAAKWQSFGWNVRRIDGHDIGQIQACLSGLPFEPGRPSCIIADTIKGKGVRFMEGELLWHYRSPDDDEVRRALQQLGEQ